MERQNEILKMDFEDCQKKNKILEERYLSLKMKFEELINEKQNVFNNPSHPKMMKCNYCKFHGHSSFTCPIKRNIPYKFRQVWVPKGTRDLVTNSQGPKAIWVPKSK